jgi:16S rRNA (cytosine1402-N4)-methyltransferase
MAPHVPVMLPEVLRALSPRDGATYVDATFGAGGYTEAILEAASCTVWAIDRDPAAIQRASFLKKRYKGRFNVLLGCFGNMASLLKAQGVEKVEGVVFDLGVSSPQLDEAERGFSFKLDGPLDMRMSQQGLSAADIVNTFKPEDIADILWRYGEEKKSRFIARRIEKVRETTPLKSTKQLASLIHDVIKDKSSKIDPATRTFQALRIFVNDEMGELERGLKAAEEILKVNGRVVAVSFHSLEDRIVKIFLREKSQLKPSGSRHQPFVMPNATPIFEIVDRKALTPSQEEIEKNPRARSAKLRWAIKKGETLHLQGRENETTIS